MPYIARRVMKHGDGYLDDGDVITDFEEWPAGTRSYMLEAGHVEFVETAAASSQEPDTGAAAAPVPAPAPRKRAAAKPAAKKPAAKSAAAKKPTTRKRPAKEA